MSTESGQNSVHSYGHGSKLMHSRVHGAMRCDFFLHGAMRCDFERQITRDDAMRWICSNHTGRCDAMGFRILKTRGDAMRWVSEIRKHGAMRCDEKRHDGRFIAIDLGIAWAMMPRSTRSRPTSLPRSPRSQRRWPRSRSS